MANGWGGRRAGAGAPKGNNNRVIHGEYCQIPAELLALSHQEAAIRCMEQMPFLDFPSDVLPSEYREWFRVSGIIGQLTDRYVRRMIRQSNARLKKARLARAQSLQRLSHLHSSLEKGGGGSSGSYTNGNTNH